MIENKEKTAMIVKAMGLAAGAILGLKYLELRLGAAEEPELRAEMEKADKVFQTGWMILNKILSPSKPACIPCGEKEKANA